MQTKPKSNPVITHAIGEDGLITFTVKDAGAFMFDPSRTSIAVQRRAAGHGFIQRISDGGAISRDPKTGVPATAEAKFARMKGIAEHYASGSDDWNIRVAARAPKGLDVGLVIRAMIRAGLVLDVDAANKAFDTIATKRDITRDASIAVWASSDKVIQAMADILAESAPTGADDLAEMEETDDNTGNEGDGVMESKQYRISPILGSSPKKYRLQVTHGFMDVETLGIYAKQVQARDAAKAHAIRTGVKPLILT